MSSDSYVRLRNLTTAREKVKQALLGIQWEERYALEALERKIVDEIRETLASLAK